MHTRRTTVAVTHEIRSYDGERRRDDEIVMAASRVKAPGFKTN